MMLGSTQYGKEGRSSVKLACSDCATTKGLGSPPPSKFPGALSNCS